MRSFYEILGVSRCATDEEILAAYRKRVIETHPDRGGDSIEFQNVRKGYEILSNIDMRKKYDKWLVDKEREGIGQSEINDSADKNSEVVYFKKRIQEKFLSLMNDNCMDTELYKDICRLYANKSEIFHKLPGTSSNSVLAAIVILRCISILPRTKPYFSTKAPLYLASVCEQILDIEKYRKKDTDNTETGRGQTNTTKTGSTLFFKTITILAGSIVFMIIFTSIGHDSEYVEHEKLVDIKYNTEHDKQMKDTIYTNSHKGSINPRTTTKLSMSQRNYSNDINAYNYKEVIYYTGDMPYKNFYGEGSFDKASLSELKFINSSYTDAVVLLCEVGKQVIRHNYIKKNEMFSMTNIPSGIYVIKVMFGNSWNSKKDNGENFPIGGFMKNVSFIKSMDNDYFNFVPDETCDGVIYPTYSVTLHKVQNGNLRTDEISKSDFFN